MVLHTRTTMAVVWKMMAMYLIYFQILSSWWGAGAQRLERRIFNRENPASNPSLPQFTQFYKGVLLEKSRCRFNEQVCHRVKGKALSSPMDWIQRYARTTVLGKKKICTR